jgi:hypothetical protein
MNRFPATVIDTRCKIQESMLHAPTSLTLQQFLMYFRIKSFDSYMIYLSVMGGGGGGGGRSADRRSLSIKSSCRQGLDPCFIDIRYWYKIGALSESKLRDILFLRNH